MTGTDHLGEEERRRVDIESIASANRSFYESFESGNLEALIDLWEHSGRVQCTHPGWSILRGWDEVGGSWAALVDSADPVQFVLTNEHIELHGDTAWVTLDENILGRGSHTVASLNIFCRTDDGWKMVAHHGSLVQARS